MKIYWGRAALYGFLVAIGTATYAQEEQTVSLADLAADYCPAEWPAAKAALPDFWDQRPEIEIDPSLDPATTTAYNRFELGTRALEAGLRMILGLSNAENQTRTYLDRARSLHALAMCLTLSDSDKGLIVDMAARKLPDISEADIGALLFKASEKFTCMNFAGFTEKVLELDPSSTAFEAEMKEIAEAELNRC